MTKAKTRSLENDVTVVILGAGYATRLYPLTLNIPKPLLMVTSRISVIDFIVDDLQKESCVKKIFVVTNDKFFDHFYDWARSRRRKTPLVVLNDGTRSNEDRLGAIGDIDHAVRKGRISGDLLVVGGDNLFDKGISHFIRFARRNRPFVSLGVYDLGNKKDAVRFGVVSLDARGRVKCFKEKPQRPETSLVATCLYYFPRQTLGLLREYTLDERTSNDASGNYIRWLLARDEVCGHVLKRGHWYDIGHFDSYRQVVANFNRKRRI